MADLTNAVWLKNGMSASADGTLTENTSTSVHIAYQNLDSLIAEGLGSTVILKAIVAPLARTKAWLGARENNGFYMASFDLTGSGTVESQGSNVSTASIVNNGDGTYTLKCVYGGTFPQTTARIAIGSLITAGSQNYTGTGVAAIRVHGAQVIKGNTDFPYVPTTDLQVYEDIALVSGQQNATLPGTNPPSTLDPLFISSVGNFGLTISDFTYDLDAVTVLALVEWNGNTDALKVIAAHWDADNDQASWLMGIDPGGNFVVYLSNDGVNVDKFYESVNAVGVNEKVMLTFTWDGTSLRMYVNDVELTTTDSTLAKTIDGALSGNLFDSSAPIVLGDLYQGKMYDCIIYDGAGTPTQIAGVAAGYGVSGSPGGGGDPGGGGPIPQNGDFVINDGIVVIEAESIDIAGTQWSFQTATPGYVGSGYLRHDGPDDFTLPPTNEIWVPFFVDEDATYTISLRVTHDQAAADDQENDCWLNVDGSTYEKWGHRPVDYGSGWTFGTFREPTSGVFTDKDFVLAAGSHILNIGGRSNNYHLDRIHIYKKDRPNSEDETTPESEIYTGGNLPATTAEMVSYLNSKGVTSIFYVNNATGNDSNSGTASQPWATIQKAANTLTGGQGCIIQGEGGRFYEQVTPPNSGTAGNLIWFVGDPENPAILDASESFNVTWTDRGGGMWSAPYNRTRYFSDETAYFAQSPGQGFVPLQTFATHQLIYDDQQLVKANSHTPTANPSSLNQGECYFKTNGTSDANFKTPTEVWVRLPGDANPNNVTMRIASDKRYLFDYSPTTWEEGFPGAESDSAPNVAAGRNYIGLVNIHFKFGSCIRKKSPLAIRGRGWFLEWCSVSDSNAYSFTVAGEEHTIINCKFIRSGQGPCRLQWAQNGSGTTLIEKCLFEDDNIHFYPPSWDAGFKISHAGDGGTTIMRDCHFNRSDAVGLWWDIFNGKQNGTGEAFLVERCIFEEQARHAIFVEHNSENVIIRNCGVWKTKSNTEGNFNQTLGTGFRIAGAGLCTFNNNIIALSDGIGFYSKAGQDGRGPNNRDTITDNVIISNNLDPNHDIRRTEYFGGDDKDEPGTYPWSSSQIDGNVFYNSLPTGVSMFTEANSDSGWVSDNTVAWFEAASRTNGQNNVIATGVAVVVEDINDRKKFWNTNFSGGSYPTKGPQGLVHYEDLPETGWSIPR